MMQAQTNVHETSKTEKIKCYLIFFSLSLVKMSPAVHLPTFHLYHLPTVFHSSFYHDFFHKISYSRNSFSQCSGVEELESLREGAWWKVVRSQGLQSQRVLMLLWVGFIPIRTNYEQSKPIPIDLLFSFSPHELFCLLNGFPSRDYLPEPS